MTFSIGPIYFHGVKAIEAQELFHGASHWARLIVTHRRGRDQLTFFMTDEEIAKITQFFHPPTDDPVLLTPMPTFHNPKLISVTKERVIFEEFEVVMFP